MNIKGIIISNNYLKDISKIYLFLVIIGRVYKFGLRCVI